MPSDIPSVSASIPKEAAMNKRVLSFIVAVCLSLSIVLCGCNQSQYTVSFEGNYYGCEEFESVTVAFNGTVVVKIWQNMMKVQ